MGELLSAVPSDGAAPTTPLGDATYPLDDWARAISEAVEALQGSAETPAEGGGGDAPWSYDFDARLPAYAQTNMNTFTSISGAPYNYGATRNTDGPGSGSVSWKVPLTAGTYSFHIVFYRETYMAQMTCTVDGTTVGTWGTQGSPGGAVLLSITGVTVATSGTKTLAVVKAASNGDLVYLYSFHVRRTA